MYRNNMATIKQQWDRVIFIVEIHLLEARDLYIVSAIRGPIHYKDVILSV